MQILHANLNNDGLLRLDKQQHQRLGERHHRYRSQQAEGAADLGGGQAAPTDPFRLLRPVILCDKGGKGVAEILSGHISESIDFYHSGKSGAGGKSKAVHQSLHHQDTKIHDGLLHRCQRRGLNDAPQQRRIDLHMAFLGTDVPCLDKKINRDAHGGQYLCNQSRGRCSGHPHLKTQDKYQIQDDIGDGRCHQNQQRRHGVADAAQHRGEEIINGYKGHPQQHDSQILPRERKSLLRNVQPGQKGIQKKQRQDIDQQRNRCNKDKSIPYSRLHAVGLTSSVQLGHHHAASHAQAQNNGGQQYHQRIGRSNSGKRRRADGLADNQCIGHVIELLQHIARDHRQAEKQQRFSDFPSG